MCLQDSNPPLLRALVYVVAFTIDTNTMLCISTLCVESYVFMTQ